MPVVAALLNESAVAATVAAGLIPACKMKFSINKKFTTKLEYKEARKFYAIRGFKQEYVYITEVLEIVTCLTAIFHQEFDDFTTEFL